MQEAFKKLADILRVSVSQPEPLVGLNQDIMQMIYKYRTLGRELDKKWQELIPQIEIGTKDEKHNFHFQPSNPDMKTNYKA